MDHVFETIFMIGILVVLGTDALIRGSYMTWWYVRPRKHRKEPNRLFCIHYRKEEPVQFWIYVCFMYGVALASAACMYWGIKQGFY